MVPDGKRYILHRSRLEEFTIWNLSDLHVLNKNADVKAIKKDIKKIKEDPCAFWLGGGDYADFIGYRDKRFDPDAVAPDVSIKDLGRLGKVGMEKVRDLFKPIAGKCLGLLLGNHELSYMLKTDQEDLHSWLCTELDVPNLGYSCIFDLAFVRTNKAKKPRLQLEVEGMRSYELCEFRVYAHHGAGYATTAGGKFNKIGQFMDNFDAEIYFLGHVHDQMGRRRTQLGGNSNCTKLMKKDRIGVISGSYLQTYTEGNLPGYGEQRGYSPTVLGAAFVKIKPHLREIRGEI